MTPREKQSKEKKEYIFRTAMTMFRERGYAETTIRDICRKADISPSTFYHFFGDKSGVLMVFFNGIYNFRDQCLSPTEEHLRDPFQTVCNYMLAIAQMQELMGKEFVRETMYANPKVYAARELTAVRYSGMHDIARFLQAAKEAGYLRPDLDTAEIAECAITWASGILFNWITLSETESATDMMRRLLPRFFATVSQTKSE